MTGECTHGLPAGRCPDCRETPEVDALIDLLRTDRPVKAQDAEVRAAFDRAMREYLRCRPQRSWLTMGAPEGRIIEPRRVRHACDVPPTGDPEGIHVGDVYRCACGRSWLAYHLPGSRYNIHWKRISRIGAWWWAR